MMFSNFFKRSVPSPTTSGTTQAMNVFYITSIEKIIKNAQKRYPELRTACNDILESIKKMEKNETDVLRDISENPNKYVRPLELACATKKSIIVEPALDCLHKLMAYGYIDSKVQYEGKSDLLIDVVIATIANCFDPTQDDNVQLQIIKALLTAVTSCDIHGRSLRLTVKTCFNIHLVSKNEVNRKTAQATLNQMLNIIFQRMESKPPKSKLQENGTHNNDTISSPSQDSPIKQDANTTIPAEKKPTQEYIDEIVDCLMDEVAQQILEQQQYDLENEEDEDDNDTPNTPTTGGQKTTRHKRTESGDEMDGNSSSTAPIFDNQYQKDAFFIFRALCRLAMKALPKK